MASKTLSTAATEILPSNASRKSLVILNEDSTDSVFIKRERAETTSVSSTDHDFKIGPGASLALSNLVDGSQAIQARYTGIASANTPRISFFETEDVVR